jgi:hypothetical protein
MEGDGRGHSKIMTGGEKKAEKGIDNLIRL